MLKTFLIQKSFLLCLGLNIKIIFGIINLHQETANPIFHRRISAARSSQASKAGLECLQLVTAFYFTKLESLTRSDNIVVGSAVNLSTPAAEIQDYYLKIMNKIVEEKASGVNHSYQLRVISDSELYNTKADAQPNGALVLADYYTIVTDSVPRLVKLIQDSVRQMISWNPGARFLILFNHVEQHGNETEITMEIYKKMLSEFYIHRITILFAINAFDYSLTTLDYFSKEACQKIISHSFGHCKNGTLDRTYDALKDQMDKIQKHTDAFNCTFNVCATIAAPFVEQDCKTGLEMKILGYIRKRLHLNIKTSCNRITRGVGDGDAWTGQLGRLQQGRCDFIIGGYYPDNDVFKNFWTSDCYFDDKHTWYIKRAEERPEWMALYSIFDKQAWLCFLLMLPITWISWCILIQALPEPKNHKELSLLAINNVGLTICVSVNERPMCHTVRIFWFALALYGMNIASIYTSRLISVFANPGYLHQIDNIQEVIKDGIPFGGSEESYDWFDNEEDRWIHRLYNISDEFEPNSANLQAVTRGQRVILSSRMYVMQHNVSDKVFAFPQNVFSSPLQMIMKPGFPFMFEINWLVRYMRDMGISAKFRNDFNFNNTYLNRIAKMRPDFPETEIVIRINHLGGCFALLILGLSSSCLIFCIETFARIGQKEKKRNKSWNSRKNKKKLKRLADGKGAEESKIKTKHTKNKESKENPKYAFVISKFGRTNQLINEQIRFTPVHRRNVFNNYNAFAAKDPLCTHINRSYF